MTFSIDRIRSTFQQVTPSVSTKRTTTYVNTTFSQRNLIVSTINSQIQQAPQKSFIKIVMPTTPQSQSVAGTIIGGRAPGFTSPAVSPAPAASQVNQTLITAVSGQLGTNFQTTTAQIVSGTAPSGVFQLPSTPTQTTAIFISSSFFGESFFSGSSMLSAPFSSDLFEFSTGDSLREDEKPKILGNIIEDVRRDGFGRRNCLIIRKMKSSRGTPKSYKILRKNMFSDRDFVEIANLTPDSLYVDPKYNEIISNIGETPQTVFIFSDNAIQINTIFIYKVQIEWNNRISNEQQRENIMAGALAIGPLGFLNITV